jgi:FKBP-type peptidyl-prolyl cis-trans isomerase
MSPPALAEDSVASDEDKAFYAIGASLARQIQMLKPLSEGELDTIVEGLRDAANDRVDPKDTVSQRPQIRKLVRARQERALELEKAAAAAFLASELEKPGARQTESGLIYREIRPGDGASPSATDKVRVHYHGTLHDGTVFDSSVDRGEPAEFPLNRVIPCWTEGVAMIKTGGKAQLVCPSKIAYGDGPSKTGRIPPGAALSFEVELLEIVK